ncbi:MAG: LysM peptidoglycan-binding domain-containing protein [Thermoguttaceae bacterium]
MGKETKIGLAVIAILFVIFGAVVFRRLTRPAEETVAATDAAEKPSAAGKADAPADDSKSTSSTATAGGPTVLSAMKLSGTAARRAPDDVTSQWITASDTAKKSSRGEASVASDAPPSTIPAPPTPAADAGYSASYDTRPIPPPSAAATPAGQSDAAVSAPAKQAVDPFRARDDHFAPAAAPGGAPSAEAANGAVRPATAAPTYPASPVDSYPAASPSGNPSSPRDRYASSSSACPTSSSAYSSSSSAYPSSPRDSYSTASPSPSYADTSRDSYSKNWPATAETGRNYSRGSAANGYDAEASSRGSGSYEVQPNDTFWLISQKVYGSGGYFKALAEHNRGKVAQRDKLRVGQTIATPTIAQLEQTYPELCPKPSHRESVRNRASLASTHGGYGGGRTYEVQEGDTLFDIARNELGKVTRWAEIYELNRDALGKDFDYLTPGMQLILPPKDAPASTDKTTRRPGSVYDR